MEFDMYHGYNFVRYIVRNHTEIKRIYVGYRKVWEGRRGVDIRSSSELGMYANVTLRKTTYSVSEVEELLDMDSVAYLKSKYGLGIRNKDSLFSFSEICQLGSSKSNKLSAELFLGFPEAKAVSGENSNLKPIDNSIGYTIPLKMSLFAVSILRSSLIDLSIDGSKELGVSSAISGVGFLDLSYEDTASLLTSEIKSLSQEERLFEENASLLTSEIKSLSQEEQLFEETSGLSTVDSASTSLIEDIFDENGKIDVSDSGEISILTNSSFIDDVEISKSKSDKLTLDNGFILDDSLVISSNISKPIKVNRIATEIDNNLNLNLSDSANINQKSTVQVENKIDLESGDNVGLEVSLVLEIESDNHLKKNQNESINVDSEIQVKDAINLKEGQVNNLNFVTELTPEVSEAVDTSKADAIKYEEKIFATSALLSCGDVWVYQDGDVLYIYRAYEASGANTLTIG